MNPERLAYKIFTAQRTWKTHSYWPKYVQHTDLNEADIYGTATSSKKVAGLRVDIEKHSVESMKTTPDI